MDLKILNRDIACDASCMVSNNIGIKLKISETIENKIFNELTEHDIISLQFLCEGIQNINVKGCGDIDVKCKLKLGFQQYKGKYTDEHKYLVVELLYHIKRFDLIRDLGSCCHQVKKLSEIQELVDPYWLLLYRVCETITEEEVQEFGMGRFQSQEEFLYHLHTRHQSRLEYLTILTCLLRGLPQLDDEIKEIINLLDTYQAQFLLYPMGNYPCGFLLIFNMVNFSPLPDKPALEPRVGSDTDVLNMKRVFCKFGFIICEEKDKTRDETLQIMDCYRQKDHTNYNCFILCFLSHGNQNGRSSFIYTSDKCEISMDEIIGKFNGNNCPTLIGKPKIFIIQACRGTNEMMPDVFKSEIPNDLSKSEKTEIMEQSDSLNDNISNSTSERTLIQPANEADILECYATRPGYVSYRIPEQGTYYIHTLCKQMLMSGGTKTFCDILTLANASVASELQTKTKNQVLQFCSSLTRGIIFKKIKPNPARKT